MRKSEVVINILLIPLDYALLVAAGATAYFLRLSQSAQEIRPVIFNLPFSEFLPVVLVVAASWLLIFAIAGLYKMRTTHKFLEELKDVALASSFGVVAIVIYIFSSADLFESRFIILASWVLAIVYVSFGRFLVRWVSRILAHFYGIGVHRMLVIGKDDLSQKLIREFSQEKSAGYKVIKHLKEPDLREVKGAIGNPGIDEVLLAASDYPRQKIVELIDFCNEKHITFRFVPNLFQALTINAFVDTMVGIPLVELQRTKLRGWGRVAKRIVDLLGAGLGLIILLPPLALIAFLIKWDSRGGVFVKLKRVREAGETFSLYKFRSMIHNAHLFKEKLAALNERIDGPLFKMKNDPRITRVGRILRKYRIDEFPQLWNVLKGEMSLVGPRPHEPEEVARYVKRHRQVMAIKPGVTGLAQVSGSSDLLFEEEVKMDTYYIENWSFWLDVKIVLKTFVVLFKDPSAV